MALDPINFKGVYISECSVGGKKKACLIFPVVQLGKEQYKSRNMYAGVCTGDKSFEDESKKLRRGQRDTFKNKIERYIVPINSYDSFSTSVVTKLDKLALITFKKTGTTKTVDITGTNRGQFGTVKCELDVYICNNIPSLYAVARNIPVQGSFTPVFIVDTASNKRRLCAAHMIDGEIIVSDYSYAEKTNTTRYTPMLDQLKYAYNIQSIDDANIVESTTSEYVRLANIDMKDHIFVESLGEKPIYFSSIYETDNYINADKVAYLVGHVQSNNREIDDITTSLLQQVRIRLRTVKIESDKKYSYEDDFKNALQDYTANKSTYDVFSQEDPNDSRAPGVIRLKSFHTQTSIFTKDIIDSVKSLPLLIYKYNDYTYESDKKVLELLRSDTFAANKKDKVGDTVQSAIESEIFSNSIGLDSVFQMDSFNRRLFTTHDLYPKENIFYKDETIKNIIRNSDKIVNDLNLQSPRYITLPLPPDQISYLNFIRSQNSLYRRNLLLLLFTYNHISAIADAL